MSRKGPKVGHGMLDFVEDLRYDVKLIQQWNVVALEQRVLFNIK